MTDRAWSGRAVKPRRESSDATFDILPWDTDVFGFPVARFRDSVRSAESLARAIELLRDRAVHLAYYAFPWDDAGLRDIARAQGGRLVDRKVTYSAACSEIVAEPPSAGVDVVRYEPDEPDETLIRLARQSGEYSRFRTDPRVEPRVFEHIYDAWIRNSANRTMADDVFVARIDGITAGLVTVGERCGRGDIGLLAVDARARRRGVGRALVARARDWTLSRGMSAAQVVTQGENTAACALYEACGYRAEQVLAVFHFWL
jgi:dTDP-4-amino-4,6-dideoxy-D-galactose acyltransferase